MYTLRIISFFYDTTYNWYLVIVKELPKVMKQVI